MQVAFTWFSIGVALLCAAACEDDSKLGPYLPRDTQDVEEIAIKPADDDKDVDEVVDPGPVQSVIQTDPCDTSFSVTPQTSTGDALEVVYTSVSTNLQSVLLAPQGTGVPKVTAQQQVSTSPPYQWKFTVSGYIKDKVILELLANPDNTEYARCEVRFVTSPSTP